MNSSFQINRSKTSTTWITPQYILKGLGEFDLDPCTPETMPWPTAKHRFTEKQDGLKQEWFGRIWLNPPYGKEAEPFLKKMVEHRYGILLMFSRTETRMFQKYIFNEADAILFLDRKIHFFREDGSKGSNGSGCGSVLAAYGHTQIEVLENCGLSGKLIIQ